MSHTRLMHMKDALLDVIEEQMTCLEEVCTKELGEAIDMIKDIEEALYYHTITQAMLTKEREEEGEVTTDHKSGISHEQRRVYLEVKEAHMGKTKLLQELEKYTKDLTTDLMDMIEGASPEEKQYLGNRLSALATKIAKTEA